MTNKTKDLWTRGLRNFAIFTLLLGTLSSCQEGGSTVESVKIDDRGRNITPFMTVFDVFLCKPANTAFVGAHRGTEQGSKWPENHLASLVELHKNGVLFAEIDVARLKDGTHILFHDGVWDKRTNRNGPVASTVWENANSILLKDTKGALTSFTPSRLEDVLIWAKDRMYLELDFKSSADEKHVIKLLTKHGMTEQVILIAYSKKQAIRLQSLAPKSMISVSLKKKGDIKAYDVLGLKSKFMAAWVGSYLDTSINKTLRDQQIPLLAASFFDTDDIAYRDKNLALYTPYRQKADLMVSDRAIFSSPHFKFTEKQNKIYQDCLRTK